MHKVSRDVFESPCIGDDGVIIYYILYRMPLYHNDFCFVLMITAGSEDTGSTSADINPSAVSILFTCHLLFTPF